MNRQQDPASVYNRYFSVVKEYVCLVSKTHCGEAEDIAHDIFLKLWQREDRLPEIESMEHYLFCMVRNRLVSEWRSGMARQKSIRHLEENTTAHGDFTEEELNYREIRRLLFRGLRSLPPRARMAYLLKEQEGLRNEDIASRMDITHSMAKQHLQLASKRIRYYLAEQLGHSGPGIDPGIGPQDEKMQIPAAAGISLSSSPSAS